MKRWYVSQTTSNVVRTPFGVVYQMIESLVRHKTPDFKWKVVWLYG
jgi:hypothetical protein